ncbi:hypothetical protein Ahy_A09g042937 isoform B [Arachis hypogaea]|uniref:Uncharacterized protein n=1 Tax=Arachis hypogaea TaxID=3818 RepID=A0A445BH48_ARAHY|nr:hypothetical protein Ahy_A09g042937 isoform B [Arachis hypogaea]
MWRAHIRGLLPFPVLITSMASLADVPSHDDDVIPPPPEDGAKEVTIPWGTWVTERPPARRRSRARAVVGTAGPSAAPSSTVSSSAPEPTYLLVQRLFRFLERERLHDHQEEDAEAPTQQDAPPVASDTTEPPQTHEEPVSHPQPQPEPEPTVVPSTDPQD